MLNLTEGLRGSPLCLSADGLQQRGRATPPIQLLAAPGLNARWLSVEVLMNEHFADSRTAIHLPTRSPQAGAGRVRVWTCRGLDPHAGDRGGPAVLATILQQGCVHGAGRTRAAGSVSDTNGNDSRTAWTPGARRQQGSRRVRGSSRAGRPLWLAGSIWSCRPLGTHRHARHCGHERIERNTRDTGDGRQQRNTWSGGDRGRRRSHRRRRKGGCRRRPRICRADRSGRARRSEGARWTTRAGRRQRC
jgi:hypothetical protein